MSKQKHDLSEWVELYTSELFSWALHKLSDEELAKDLIQDTFVAAAEKIQDFRGDSAPKTWLFSILNYKIIDVYRKKAKLPVTTNTSIFTDFFDEDGSWLKTKRPQPWHDDDPHLLDDHDFQLVLKKCMDALPEKWNSCMKFKYLMNKPGDEICQELDISPTNFWQIMHRAKLNLRDCIDKNWFAN